MRNPAEAWFRVLEARSNHDKHALKAIGGRVIDMRTQLGKALAQ
jgi:hypothetical protein